MGISLNNTKVYVDLKDKAAHADVDEVLGRVKEALPNSKIVSRIDSEAEKDALLNSIDISVSGLSLFIWCICFFVYYNIVDSKFRAQKRLWGVLRAMGVKRGNVIAAHIVETLTVSLAAVLLNLIILLIVMLSPVRNDIPIVTFRLLGAYLASALFFAVGTLPAVLSQFNPRIIEQIEYID